MVQNKGIALRLAVWILASVTIIFTAIFGYSYIISRKIILQNVERNAETLALATVNRIDSVLRAVESVPRSLAIFMEDFMIDEENLLRMIRSVVERNPEIYGAAVAFEPNAFKSEARAFAPYFYKKGGKIELIRTLPYEYFEWDWYQIPKETDGTSWSEPYYDEGAGEILMTTFSVPFYRTVSGKRELMGVVTADISLEWLQEIVASVKIASTGYGFLISRNGTLVTHPDSSLVMNETIFTVAEANGYDRMREIGRAMIRGETGFVPYKSPYSGRDCWMRFAPLPSNGWSLGVLFPQEELLADVFRFNRTVLFLGIAGFLIVLVTIVWISGSITGPLRSLSRAAEVMATGNLDVEIPSVKAKDEVGTLSESFRFMKDSLKRHIAELKETTAVRERIESELRIAHEIQMGILPKIFPPYPNRPEFDILALLEPAREVGGDLYDFFFMDDDHLCFTIGDVSGKGVPAALFMAVTKTLIKTKATHGLRSEEILDRVNFDLSIDNDSMMFVTLFLGILDIRTGELAYCCAGHNPPYLIPGGGGVEALRLTGGIALGVMEDCSYRSHRIFLQKGDTLFLYTDGVTEATDGSEALFTEKRLVDELGLSTGKSLREIISGVMAKVESFSQGVPQTDDITMLALRYYGKPE